MSAALDTVAVEAERLPALDRIRLVERLLATLDRPDPSIDRAWADEGEARLDAYLNGEMAAQDAEHVFDKHSKP